jgi:hypothetical protein
VEESKSNKFMVNRLREMMLDEEITKEYDVQFIRVVYERLQCEKELSVKQSAYISKLFHEVY